MVYFYSVSTYKLHLKKPLGLCYGCIIVEFWWCGGIGVLQLCLLGREQEERMLNVCCYGCRGDQERINVFAVPRTP